MPGKEQAFRPSVSDAALKAATAKDWAGWFAVLDRAKASALSHKDIARLIVERHKIPGWWAQTIAVNFERARGLCVRHQKAGGQFSVSVSKTFPRDVATLYRAVVNTDCRVRWLPTGAFKISSQTTHKYVRGAWKLSARMEFGFLPKGADKAQITVQIDKLKDSAAVERERALWKKAFVKLSAMLEI